MLSKQGRRAANMFILVAFSLGTEVLAQLKDSQLNADGNSCFILVEEQVRNLAKGQRQPKLGSTRFLVNEIPLLSLVATRRSPGENVTEAELSFDGPGWKSPDEINAKAKREEVYKCSRLLNGRLLEVFAKIEHCGAKQRPNSLALQLVTQQDAADICQVKVTMYLSGTYYHDWSMCLPGYCPLEMGGLEVKMTTKSIIGGQYYHSIREYCLTSMDRQLFSLKYSQNQDWIAQIFNGHPEFIRETTDSSDKITRININYDTIEVIATTGSFPTSKISLMDKNTLLFHLEDEAQESLGFTVFAKKEFSIDDKSRAIFSGDYGNVREIK